FLLVAIACRGRPREIGRFDGASPETALASCLRPLFSVGDVQVHERRVLMKVHASVIAGLMAAGLIAGPGFAAENAMSPPTTGEKPARMAMTHHVTGSVVNVDENAKTFTVKDAKGKEYVLSTNSAAGTQVGPVNAGERVKVSYKKGQNGG